MAIGGIEHHPCCYYFVEVGFEDALLGGLVVVWCVQAHGRGQFLELFLVDFACVLVVLISFLCFGRRMSGLAREDYGQEGVCVEYVGDGASLSCRHFRKKGDDLP